MELRDYLKVYWSQRWLIGSIVLVATVAAYVVTATQPVRTGVSVSYAVNRVNKEATPDYQYDGYYALQATDLFAQTVVSWFSTPSVLQEMYGRANLDSEIQSVDSLPSRFRVKKYSAQNIVVRFTERDEARAQALVRGMAGVMGERTSQLNRSADNKSIFEVVGSTPVIAPAQPNPWLYAGAVLVLSFGLALLVAAARHYLRQ